MGHNVVGGEEATVAIGHLLAVPEGIVIRTCAFTIIDVGNEFHATTINAITLKIEVEIVMGAEGEEMGGVGRGSRSTTITAITPR